MLHGFRRGQGERSTSSSIKVFPQIALSGAHYEVNGKLSEGKALHFCCIF